MKRKKIFWWLKLLVSLGLIAWLIRYIGLEEILGVLPGTAYGWLLAGVAVIATGFFLNGASLWILYDTDPEHRPGMGDFFRAFFQTTFIALWLPGRVGDFSIALLLKEHASAENSLVYVLADKLITLVAVGLVATIGCFVLVSATAGLACAAAMALAWISISVIMRRRPLYDFFLGRLPHNVRESLRRFRRIWTELAGRQRTALALNLVVTLVRLWVIAWSVVFLLRAFGGGTDYTTALYALSIVQLLSLVPISVQGIGVTETAYVLLLSQQGQASEAAILAFCLIGRILNIGVVALLHLGAMLTEVTAGKR